jgi:hypothetical protein
MTTNYEPPSEHAVAGAAGFFEPEDTSPDAEEPETVLPEEDDERARREQDRERRAEDVAP